MLDGVLSNTSSVALSCSSGLDLTPQDAAAYPELTALPRSVCVFQRCAVCMLWVCGGGTERLVLSLTQVLNQMVQDVLAFNEAAVTFLPFLDLQSTIPPWSTAFILYVFDGGGGGVCVCSSHHLSTPCLLASHSLRSTILRHVKEAHLRNVLAATTARSTARVNVCLSRLKVKQATGAASCGHARRESNVPVQNSLVWQLTEALRDVSDASMCHSDQCLRITLAGEGGTDQGVRTRMRMG